MVTVEMASTLPMACKSTGMVREATVATLTGAPAAPGLAACTASLLLQPRLPYPRPSNSSANDEV